MKTQLKSGHILVPVTFSVIALSTCKVNTQCVAPPLTPENTAADCGLKGQIEVAESYPFVKNTEGAFTNVDALVGTGAMMKADSTALSLRKQTQGIPKRTLFG